MANSRKGSKNSKNKDITSPLIIEMQHVAEEKGISLELVLEALETSLINACKRHFETESDFRVTIDKDTGAIEAFRKKIIKKQVKNPEYEISLEEAKFINHILEEGEYIETPVDFEEFSRIAAMTAKQVITQKFRDVERENLYNELVLKEHKILSSKVERVDRNNVIVVSGKMQGLLVPASQIKTEKYAPGDRLKVYVSEVKQTTKDPIMYVSRTAPELVKLLFEAEVPEILDGIVEIKSISREPGARTKVAVLSHDENIDPIGALVGQNGSRINVVVDELYGEKIDILPFSYHPETFIANALAPSDILSVVLNEEEKSAKVVVPKDQLSLAIGKDGQNVRLAVRLTGFKIDISSDEIPYEEDEYEEEMYEQMYKEAFDNDNQ